jgi:hypothetical protein
MMEYGEARMPEETNELMLEILKDLQNGQRKILDRIGNIESEMLSLRKQVHSLQGDSIRRDQLMAELSLNMDRINTRLDLSDA